MYNLDFSYKSLEQRQKETGPKKFESAGNDSITGNIDLGMFEPR